MSPISSNKEILNSSLPTYDESGFNERVIDRKTQKRWNPPFCKSAKINIGKMFLYLTREHFPTENPFEMVLHKNTVKSSYTFVSNLLCVILAYNKIL